MSHFCHWFTWFEDSALPCAIIELCQKIAKAIAEAMSDFAEICFVPQTSEVWLNNLA